MIRSIVVLLALAMLSGPVLAHKVNVFAYVEGERLHIEGYFNDGKKARNSVVNITDAEGNVLISDTTNDEGQLVIDIPSGSAQMHVVLKSGMGHQAEYVIPAEDVAASTVSKSAETKSPTSPVSNVQAGEMTAQAVSPSVDQAQLESMIQQAVSEAIRPLARELAASRERASLGDIIGGVGLIVGLLGGFAFLKARQSASAAKNSNDGGN